MQPDFWHFPRIALAKQVLNLFDIGLSSALTFFAPRRMGKTEFLRKDIIPVAEKENWGVHYFSFLDTTNNAQERYKKALYCFAIDVGAIKPQAGVLQRIKKVAGQVGSIKAEFELNNKEMFDIDIQYIIDCLGKQKKTLLLLDEIQALAHHETNASFLANLRTALDTNKDNVKTIFTGSSREGLRNMFSQAEAPFFHFGQNLDFPELNKTFTDHLCDAFTQATTRTLDKAQLWQAFKEMSYVPQLIRALVERLVLNPNYGIAETKQQLLHEVYDDRAYDEIWCKLSALEQLLLLLIANGETAIYGKPILDKLSLSLGVDSLKISTVQSAVRTLNRKNILIKSSTESGYRIDDPNLVNWLLDNSD